MNLDVRVRYNDEKEMEVSTILLTECLDVHYGAAVNRHTTVRNTVLSYITFSYKPGPGGLVGEPTVLPTPLQNKTEGASRTANRPVNILWVPVSKVHEITFNVPTAGAKAETAEAKNRRPHTESEIKAWRLELQNKVIELAHSMEAQAQEAQAQEEARLKEEEAARAREETRNALVMLPKPNFNALLGFVKEMAPSMTKEEKLVILNELV